MQCAQPTTLFKNTLPFATPSQKPYNIQPKPFGAYSPALALALEHGVPRARCDSVDTSLALLTSAPAPATWLVLRTLGSRGERDRSAVPGA